MASFGVPRKAVRALASSRILSNMEYTSDDGWWMVQMIVLPLDAIDLSTLTTFWAMYESRPEVGSSQNISGGSVNTCTTCKIKPIKNTESGYWVLDRDLKGYLRKWQVSNRIICGLTNSYTLMIEEKTSCRNTAALFSYSVIQFLHFYREKVISTRSTHITTLYSTPFTIAVHVEIILYFIVFRRPLNLPRKRTTNVSFHRRISLLTSRQRQW